MATILDDLVALLALEKIEENIFRGQSQDLGWGTVFGGQVLGQALSAAARTVPADRHAHSLHAYFLRPGDVSRPIVYDVDRIRDGGSFTTRTVKAIQHGKPILNVSASFQVDETGFEHQDPMPDAPAPESLPTEQERVLAYADKMPAILRERATAPRPFEMRTTDPDMNPFQPVGRVARRQLWVRAVDKLPDEPALHRYLLAYVSDFTFVTTALLPHGVSWLTRGMHVASIDHAIYFHRPFRCDEWLLHDIESTSASGGRGLVRGRFFTRDGRMVASTIQEGLIRRKPPKP